MFGVLKVLDERGINVPSTYSMGNVEIRSARSDTPRERQALAQSQETFGEKDDLTIASRIFTIVETTNMWEAGVLATERFEEALDILASRNFGLSRIALQQTGCVRSFECIDTVTPLKLSRRQTFGASTSFWIMPWKFPADQIDQYLARQAQSNRSGDATGLSQRLVRSYHWARKAHLEPNRQLKILFRWFAMESIWTNDAVVSRIMWALGFPTGLGQRLLAPDFIARLQSHQRYSHWRSELNGRLESLRVFRNESVHSGFRAQDRSAEELRRFYELTTWACPRVQRQAAAGIAAGLETVEELGEYLPLIVDGDQSYIDGAHGTIIWSLENRMPLQDE